MVKFQSKYNEKESLNMFITSSRWFAPFVPSFRILVITWAARTTSTLAAMRASTTTTALTFTVSISISNIIPGSLKEEIGENTFRWHTHIKFTESKYVVQEIISYYTTEIKIRTFGDFLTLFILTIY